MVFSSLTFLFFFLPIVCVGYLIVSRRYANLWLLICSLFFYYLGAKQYLPLLLGVIAVSYGGGRIIKKAAGQGVKRLCMALSIGVLLIFMLYFKYWDFLIKNINAIFHTDHQLKGIIFPIGISFFTFQAISYLADVYKGQKSMKNPVDVALYISFFPQLVAGPIVRYSDIKEYLNVECRTIRLEDASLGFWRFSIGLCKKVLLANTLGGLADIVFSVYDISQHSVMYTWLGAIAYTLQIYYDFSGYSDMAIGLGRIFGFRFKENFHYPYAASSIRDFWQRWHISLSGFFRDYVYIPLGGNRCSTLRWCCNMLVVWLLTGLWHGASWNFVIWGLLYCILLIVERILHKKDGDQGKSGLRQAVGHAYTMLIVILAWVIFRTGSVQEAFCYGKNMFGFGADSFADQGFLFQLRNYLPVLILGTVFSFPLAARIRTKFENATWYRIVSAVLLGSGLLISVSCIYMGSYNPFLYFMF